MQTSLSHHVLCCFLISCALATPLTFAQTAPPAPTSLASLEQRATAAYTAKQYAESASLFAQAVQLSEGSQRASDEYNEACSLALSGDKARALAVLTQSVDDGFGERDHLAADTDLLSLHNEAAWPALLTRLDAIKKAQDMRWGTAAFKSNYVENLSDADKVAGLSLL